MAASLFCPRAERPSFQAARGNGSVGSLLILARACLRFASLERSSGAPQETLDRAFHQFVSRAQHEADRGAWPKRSLMSISRYRTAGRRRLAVNLISSPGPEECGPPYLVLQSRNPPSHVSVSSSCPRTGLRDRGEPGQDHRQICQHDPKSRETARDLHQAARSSQIWS